MCFLFILSINLFVKSTSSFPGSGDFIVGYETISYTAKTDEKFSYLLQFDQSINLDDIWVNSKTLDFLNNYRDNIFVMPS